MKYFGMIKNWFILTHSEYPRKRQLEHDLEE